MAKKDKWAVFDKRSLDGRFNDSFEMDQVMKRMAWHWRETIEEGWREEAKKLGLKELPEKDQGLPSEHYGSAMQYLLLRIAGLTGIDAGKLEGAAWRWNSGSGLKGYTMMNGQVRPDLTDIPPKLTALDAGGHTRGIVRELIERYPKVAEETRLPRLLDSAERRTPNASREERKPPKVHAIEPHNHAIALLISEPEISPTDLAERVGVSRSTLYKRTKKWDPVRKTLLARDSGRIPNGSKSDGMVEAEFEDQSEWNET